MKCDDEDSNEVKLRNTKKGMALFIDPYLNFNNSSAVSGLYISTHLQFFRKRLSSMKDLNLEVKSQEGQSSSSPHTELFLSFYDSSSRMKDTLFLKSMECVTKIKGVCSLY